jgi:ubiquinone/menaquinone biosynthesis C-methylase UbiE
MTPGKNPPVLLFDSDRVNKAWEDVHAFNASHHASWDGPWPFLEEVLIPHLKPTMAIADFGSGDGRNVIGLARAGHHITCVDVSSKGLQRGLERFQANGLPWPTMVLGNIEELPLADLQFHAALCIDVFPQVRRPERALAEMNRTLVDGGLLVLNLLTPADPAFGDGERIGPRSFLYKNNLYNFYEDRDFQDICRRMFNVIERRDLSWEDPPHFPFKPFQHKHEGILYTLLKS